MAANGRQAWMDQVAELATSLYPRLLRPVGERFAPAPKSGYSKRDVDALMDRIAAYFDSDGAVTSDEVRSATFGSAKRDRAYEETSVDLAASMVSASAALVASPEMSAVSRF